MRGLRHRDEQDVGAARRGSRRDLGRLLVGEVAVAVAGDRRAADAARGAARARARAPRRARRGSRRGSRARSARPSSSCIRSMPATRSGSGSPSSREAQTTLWPSAVTSSQPSTISRSAASSCIATSLAALIAMCCVKRPSAITLLDRAPASRSMSSRSIAQPRTSARGAHAARRDLRARDRGNAASEGVGRALGGVAVPQRDRARRRARGRVSRTVEQARGVVAEQHVRAVADRHRAARCWRAACSRARRARRPPPARRPSR